MNINSNYLSNQQYSRLNSSMFSDDSFDEYLENPRLNVSDMIQQYNVSVIPNRRRKEEKNLRCAVCNAKALGYNFDQISCESCKAFFRRNALRNINELRCRFSGHCHITVETRRHCPYCRIKKCFAVGMRKEWIRSEEEKEMKRFQLQRNRRRKNSQEQIEIPTIIPFQPSNDRTILTSIDRTRLNNITHCYDQYTNEPCHSAYRPAPKLTLLRLDELYNRKKSIFVNVVSYFKHLPEFQNLNIDDQVSLVKRNIRLVIPLNYAIFRAPVNSNFGRAHIQTIGCKDNVNLHDMLRPLAQSFVGFVIYDPLIIKLLIIVLFFTTNSLTTRSIYDPPEYKQLNNIKEIQTSYVELLWLYMIEKYGEKDTIHLFTKMITKYLYIQTTIDQVDSIIEVNNDIQNIDSLMKTMLQLT